MELFQGKNWRIDAQTSPQPYALILGCRRPCKQSRLLAHPALCLCSKRLQQDGSCKSVRSTECSNIPLKVAATTFIFCQTPLGVSQSNLYALEKITCSVWTNKNAAFFGRVKWKLCNKF